MGTQRWFVQEDAGERGPLSSRELKELARSGGIGAESRVRHDGMKTFVPARRIQGLMAPPADMTAAPPVPALPSLPPLPVALPDLPTLPDASEAVDGEDPFEPRQVPASLPRSADGHLIASASALAANSVDADQEEVAPPRTRPRTGGYRPPRHVARAPARMDASAPVMQPSWTRLWPLAVLSLLLGWIGGGFLSFDRMYVPGTVLPIALLALGGVPLAAAGIFFYLRPLRIRVGLAVGVCVFTAVVGILVLLLLQYLAAAAAHGHYLLHGRGAIIWALLAAIGKAYEMTTSDNMFARWIGYVFGVGLCEETTKLLPLVALILWRMDRSMSVHAFLVLGFVSGMGFGISEALYCYSPWTGNYDAGSNIIRWYSAIPSHGLYTAVCAAFLWKLADRLEYADGFWPKLGVVAMAVGVMAVVHGTYDTICSLGVTLSLVMEILSFALLVWAVRWVSRDASEPVDPPVHSWSGLLQHPGVLAAGVVGALALYGLALAQSSSRERALPKILMASLPEPYRAYITGVDLAPAADAGGDAGSAMPIAAHFQISLHDPQVIGSFTNTSHDVLHHLVLTCHGADPEDPEHLRIRIGDLAAGAVSVIDRGRGWEFAPGESVTIEADDHPTLTLTLP